MFTEKVDGKTVISDPVAGTRVPATLDQLDRLAWKIASRCEFKTEGGKFAILGAHVWCRRADGTEGLVARPAAEIEVDAPYTHPYVAWQCWPKTERRGSLSYTVTKPYQTWYVRCPEGHVWTFHIAYIREGEE